MIKTTRDVEQVPRLQPRFHHYPAFHAIDDRLRIVPGERLDWRRSAILVDPPGFLAFAMNGEHLVQVAVAVEGLNALERAIGIDACSPSKPIAKHVRNAPHLGRDILHSIRYQAGAHAQEDIDLRRARAPDAAAGGFHLVEIMLGRDWPAVEDQLRVGFGPMRQDAEPFVEFAPSQAARSAQFRLAPHL